MATPTHRNRSPKIDAGERKKALADYEANRLALPENGYALASFNPKDFENARTWLNNARKAGFHLVQMVAVGSSAVQYVMLKEK